MSAHAIETYGSLFSGIGGLDLGVEAATGAKPLWQCESDPYCRAVLERHWPDTPCYNDVREIDDQAQRPDLICGGFPCQDVSQAGKRRGLDGERSGLWSEFARVIRILRPRVVFVENVAGLLVRGFDEVLGDLAWLGFDARWSCLRAADIGAPHLRRRVFLLAHSVHDGRQGLSSSNNNHGSDEPGDIANRRHTFPPAPSDSRAWAAWRKSGGPEPSIRRGTYGPPRGMDANRRRRRIRHLGNAVVPQCAERAFRELIKSETVE